MTAEKKEKRKYCSILRSNPVYSGLKSLQKCKNAHCPEPEIN